MDQKILETIKNDAMVIKIKNLVTSSNLAMETLDCTIRQKDLNY